jgi:hypothetical protein
MDKGIVEGKGCSLENREGKIKAPRRGRRDELEKTSPNGAITQLA